MALARISAVVVPSPASSLLTGEHLRHSATFHAIAHGDAAHVGDGVCHKVAVHSAALHDKAAAERFHHQGFIQHIDGEIVFQRVKFGLDGLNGAAIGVGLNINYHIFIEAGFAPFWLEAVILAALRSGKLRRTRRH